MKTDSVAPKTAGHPPFGCFLRSCGDDGKQITVEMNKDIRVEGKSLATLQLTVTTAPGFSREDDFEAMVNQLVAVLGQLTKDIHVFLAVA